MPGFRNWQNDAQVEDLARIWNVDPFTIPYYSEPAHAMQIFRYAGGASAQVTEKFEEVNEG